MASFIIRIAVCEGMGGFFDEMVKEEGAGSVKSGLCVICKGAHMLCGKERCPLMIKFYSRQRSRPITSSKDLAGSSPPGVFIGRYGYPKVAIGPLLPGEFGDTKVMDTPEMWMGKSIDDVVSMRDGLVRGKFTIDAKDQSKWGKDVLTVQELSLTKDPVSVEAKFSERPHGRIVLDDEIQPFGPSAKMESFSKSNGKWERNLEKGYYDTDENAKSAVLEAYYNGTLISEIQKAFSAGTLGVQKNRRFVPTRWSITAVDDIIGKDYLSRTRWYPTIDDYRVYHFEQLDNRWCIIMLPTTWRFELIEAWYPDTAWNPARSGIPSGIGDNDMFGRGVEIIHDSEFFDSRWEYAHIGGCYYASRMAVNELLEREHRTAGAVICREAHPGYVMPVGVWNVRENVRMALKQEPHRFDSLDGALGYLCSVMDIPRRVWIRNSDVLTDFLRQRRIEDYYGKSKTDLGPNRRAVTSG